MDGRSLRLTILARVFRSPSCRVSSSGSIAWRGCTGAVTRDRASASRSCTSSSSCTAASWASKARWVEALDSRSRFPSARAICRPNRLPWPRAHRCSRRPTPTLKKRCDGSRVRRRRRRRPRTCPATPPCRPRRPSTSGTCCSRTTTRTCGTTHDGCCRSDGPWTPSATGEKRSPPRAHAGRTSSSRDVMMPELDGFGLLKELRADPELAAVPVVMLSARAGEEARLEGLAASADDYLVKPFSARDLLARVDAQLLKSRASNDRAAARASVWSACSRTPRSRLRCCADRITSTS